MHRRFNPLQVASTLLGIFILASVTGAAQDVPLREVHLGGASLSPTTIKANPAQLGTLQSSATLTVSVAASCSVVQGTTARVELIEDSNTSGVSYSVSGGQSSNGRVYDVTMPGGCVSKTITFTITGTGSTGGSVQFRVTITAVSNPPDTPPPAATIADPKTLTAGLMLTFQAATSTSGGGGGGGIVTFCNREQNPDDPDCTSPVLVDVNGDGFSLTDAQGGVDFDLNSDGYPSRTAWTRAYSDDAWLALDRNADGKITLGAELFGNFTPQPQGANPNGFLALAEFDRPENGGDGDGVISAKDGVFNRLRLWQDNNHDGVSDAGELHTLPELGVTEVELGYKESKRADEYGNQFRYRAKVWRERESRAGRWAWDVFLVTGQ